MYVYGFFFYISIGKIYLVCMEVSDHFSIILTSAEGEARTRLPRWRLERADWQLLSQLCSTARTVDCFDSTDEVAYFANVVTKTSGHFPWRPVPWWSPECTPNLKEERAAFSRLRGHRGDPLRLDAFRRALSFASRVDIMFRF